MNKNLTEILDIFDANFSVKNKPYAFITNASKSLVETLLAMNTRNRPVKKRVVATYQNDIENRRWWLTNQGIGVDKDGVLLDGQHRLLAIKNAGYPAVPLLIVAGLDAKSQDVVDLHAKRSIRDVWKLVFDTVVAFHAPAICNILMREKQGWHGGASSAYSAQDLMDIYIDYSDAIECVLSSTPSPKFFPAPFLAAFVQTLKKEPTKESEIKHFIQSVQTGENLTKKMPAYHVRNLIILHKGTKGGGSLQFERFKKTVKALEAFLAGQEIGVLRF